MITKTWSRCGIPSGTAPSSANIGPATRASTRPRVAAFFIIGNYLSFRRSKCWSRFSIGIGWSAGNLVKVCCCPVTISVQLCEYRFFVWQTVGRTDKREEWVLIILELFVDAVVRYQPVPYTRLLSL